MVEKLKLLEGNQEVMKKRLEENKKSNESLLEDISLLRERFENSKEDLKKIDENFVKKLQDWKNVNKANATHKELLPPSKPDLSIRWVLMATIMLVTVLLSSFLYRIATENGNIVHATY